MNPDKVIKKIVGDKYKFANKKDWDHDGVNDKKDCKPHNPLRQDIVAAQGIQRVQSNMDVMHGGKFLKRPHDII